MKIWLRKKYEILSHIKLILYTTGEFISKKISLRKKTSNIKHRISKLFQQHTNGNKTWSYKMLIIGPSGSGKTNALLNLIQQDNNMINKIYLYAKDLEEPKYKFVIKKREDTGQKYLNDPGAFINYSNTMDDVYNNVHDYNAKRKRKVLIVFDHMIADIVTNKKFQAIIKELFMRCRKLNI